MVKKDKCMDLSWHENEYLIDLVNLNSCQKLQILTYVESIEQLLAKFRTITTFTATFFHDATIDLCQ